MCRIWNCVREWTTFHWEYWPKGTAAFPSCQTDKVDLFEPRITAKSHATLDVLFCICVHRSLEWKYFFFFFRWGNYLNISFTTLEGDQACVGSDNHQLTGRNLRIWSSDTLRYWSYGKKTGSLVLYTNLLITYEAKPALKTPFGVLEALRVVERMSALVQ